MKNYKNNTFYSNHIYKINEKYQPTIKIANHLNQKIEEEILFPHYTNDKFKNGKIHTVFLLPGYKISNNTHQLVKDLNYVYSDRLSTWFPPEEKDNADDQAKKIIKHTNTPAFYQEYLRILYKNPELKLIHIAVQINTRNGHSLQIYGYEE